jgi:glycine rich protein
MARADTFVFTGGEQMYVAPAGVNLVHVVAVGAPGGATPGPNDFPLPSRGALVSADLPVVAGQTVLYVDVGGPGIGFSAAGPTGGFNGGGSGGVSFTAGWAPGGGGASDIRMLPAAQAGSLGSRLIVAAGGGGASSDFQPGGAAGSDAPLLCGPCGGNGDHIGRAGTSGAGGAGGTGCSSSLGDGSSGALGEGGMGGLGETLNGSTPVGADASGGGGGGGYYGGGGGGGVEDPANGLPFCASPDTGGGGGGSSFVTPQAQNASVGLSPAGSAPEVVITVPIPTALAPPQLSGSAIVGDTLTETQAAWANTPTTITDQWLRCDATGSLAGCQDIAGATTDTYRLLDADAGGTIRVEETASNLFGTGIVAISAPTGVVQLALPSVIPPGRPTARTMSATKLGKTTALLNAIIDSNGEPVAVAFQFSRRANLSGARTTRSVTLQPGASPVRVSLRVSRLARHTRYYFRAVAIDTEHHTTVMGRVLSFKTARR